MTILIAAIIPALLALVVATAMLVAIFVCKNMSRKKQSYYIDPSSLPETIAPHELEIYHNESSEETKNHYVVCGVNAMATTDQDVGKISFDLSPECQDTMLLSSNPSYGTNVAIAEQTWRMNNCMCEISVNNCAKVPRTDECCYCVCVN